MKAKQNYAYSTEIETRRNTEGSLKIEDTEVTSKSKMNVLGLTFDSRLQWGPQISRTIKSANSSLQAIRIIKKFFTTTEIIQLLTSNYYTRLYYGSEIWQLPTLNKNCKNLLLSASANALRLCNRFNDQRISYVDLHIKYKRALPRNFCVYKHCLCLII